MKLLKIIFYSAVIVILTVVSAMIFKAHPEVQLAFFLPGIFIVVYSKLRDDVYLPVSVRLRIARGR